MKRIILLPFLLIIYGWITLACRVSAELAPSSPPPELPSPTFVPSSTSTRLPTATTSLPKALPATITPTSSPYGDWRTYRNTAFGFELMYPPGGVLSSNLPDSARIDLPFLQGTNLEEKFLDIHAQDFDGSCLSPLAQNLPPDALEAETILIGLLEYTVVRGSEGAAGSRYNWTSYAIQDEDTCVTLDFVLHSSNPENYPTPPPLYDMGIESRVFNEIAATFTWLAP
ncbi:MAG: hypothetical protein ACOY16_01000 [Chloroflexota bacterium]